MTRPAAAVAALAFLLFGLLANPADAIPVFAHRYGLTCQACHTSIPHLTRFGEAFLAQGYRMPERQPGGAFPVAVKVNLAYGSEASGGLPKAIVDEIELLTGGSIGKRGAYFAEQYAVDGGVPGRTRDFWATWRATPDDARIPMWLRGGQFTLDLPIDPETFRETTDHYAIWDQTAGDNPFTFFAPKAGLMARFGGADGLSGSFAAVQGHDPGSGLPSRGIDRMVSVQHARGALVLSAYRYDGTRLVDGFDDRFWREGYGIGLGAGRLRFDAVYQRGYDVHANAEGGLWTTGGFAQLRYDLAQRWFALARYDGTQDTAFSRSLIAGIGYRPARNARLLIFDTMHRDGDARARVHTLSSALLFAY